MAYTDDAVKAKLSALNETQESIVTVAQWVMFHRRHADRTAQLWLQKIRDANSPKRLNLIYLANEVAQQSKARRKDDFLIAFSPIITEATAIAFKGAPTEVQQKLRRVVEVWRQRHIFDDAIQEAVEARVEEIDRNKSTGKKPLLGGSLFSSSQGALPPELQPLPPKQLAVTKAAASSTPAVAAASAEHDKLNDPASAPPPPPVHAARLSQLLKSLANAENAVSETIRSRDGLVRALEAILHTNKTALAAEQAQLTSLRARKSESEARKKVVEDAIMRSLTVEQGGDGGADNDGTQPAHSVDDDHDIARPQMEELTPPPVEALTPVGSPDPQQQQQQQQEKEKESPSDQPNFNLSDALSSPSLNPNPPGSHPGFPDLSAGSGGIAPDQHPASTSTSPSNGTDAGASSAKRRKVRQDSNEPHGASGDDAMEGLDSEVAELLRQASANVQAHYG